MNNSSPFLPPESTEDEVFAEWFERVEGRKLTEDEEEFLRQVQSYQDKYEGGKELTHQQKHLALVQAYQIGDV